MNVNRPDKVTLDAYSDPQLQTQNPNGVYSRFTNLLQTPILNAKGLQLLDTTFVNSMLQLNDNSQLMFWYYLDGARNAANLRCVRLLPSSYVPLAGYTTFTRNRYFNSVVELVAALNQAASTGGDDLAFNPYWQVNFITFSYDTNTRRISIDSTGNAISPAAADDVFVIQAQQGLNVKGTIRMNPVGNLFSAANSPRQPQLPGVSMNARLGFAMGFATRPLNIIIVTQGAANSTGSFLSTPIEADASPILLGTQNVRVYLNVVGGSGIDSTGRKNLLQTIPISVAPLNIQSYSVPLEKPALSVPNEIYEMSLEFLDDYGQPFLMPPNYNTSVALAVYY